jgi:hydrogenase maturation protein HypF
LFDAVAAVVLNRRIVDYEAQAAIELEGLAVHHDDESAPESYTLQIRGGDWSKHEPAIISAQPMWHALVLDLLNGVDKSRIAAQFHAGVAAGFVRAAMLAQNATGINTVALSGGAMHNRRLARLLRSELKAAGFNVYQHRRVSPGDGGLSYGQAAAAAAILRKSESPTGLFEPAG